jgi:hypothetical protein
MNLIALLAFLAANIVAIRRPGFALALVVSLFAVKQLVQAGNPWLILTTVGSFTINAIVLASAVGSVVLRISRTGRQPIGTLNVPWASTMLLFAWSTATCLWTPNAEPLAAVTTGLPYFVLVGIVAPFLVRDWAEAEDFQVSMLWIGVPAALMILVSPDFTVKYGRLGLDVGATRSNPLALGEFGGLIFIAAVTLRKPGTALLVLRVTAMLLGAALAIRSGSRGQFIYAMAVAIVFYPLGASVRNPRAAVATIVGIALIAFIGSQLLEFLLEDPREAKRFTLEELVYGRSSASGRVINVLTLYNAWLSNPLAPIIGLGLGAFSYYSESVGDPYSHVLFADAIFELGLPGAALMLAFTYTSVIACFGVLRASADNRARRCTAVLLVAWFVYELLLVNKQGALWGVSSMFPAGAIMWRLVFGAERSPTGSDLTAEREIHDEEP